MDIDDLLLLNWLTSPDVMSATYKDTMSPKCRCSQAELDVLRFVLNQTVNDSCTKHQADKELKCLCMPSQSPIPMLTSVARGILLQS